MANSVFGAIEYTGGTAGALDTIKVATLGDGDIGIVTDNSNNTSIYRFDSSATTAEDAVNDPPKVIRPDDYSTGGVWELTNLNADDIKVYDDITIVGDCDFRGNIDIDGSLTFDGGATTIDTILDEDTMASNDPNAIATQQSIKAYVDTQLAGVTVSYDYLAGFAIPTIAEYNSATAIDFLPARYHHNGTSEQMVKWDATITFTLESGGSNGDSDDFGTEEWHYIYLDDSAIVAAGSTTISATELLNSTTAPTWDADQLGWYNGNDRCIAAFYIDDAGDILEFLQDGPYIQWYEHQLPAGAGYASDPVTAMAPSFCRRVKVNFRSAATTSVYIEHAKCGTDNLIYTNRKDDDGENQADSLNSLEFDAFINSSLQFGLAGNAYCYQWGYYLPRGIY